MTRLVVCVVCRSVVADGRGPRCSECRRLWNRAYNAARPELHAFYATPEWRRLSAEVRAGAARCTHCLAPTTRLIADHVIPLDQRPDLALERSNVVPSCYGCNSRRARNAKRPDLTPQASEPAPARSPASADPSRPQLAGPLPLSSNP